MQREKPLEMIPLVTDWRRGVPAREPAAIDSSGEVDNCRWKARLKATPKHYKRILGVEKAFFAGKFLAY